MRQDAARLPRIAFGFALVLGLVPSAQASLGSCEYRLYSQWLKRSLLVCQTADDVDKCGSWPRPNPNVKLMAYAEGKTENELTFQKGGCDAERTVALCVLPSGSAIYFYEGNPKDLAAGCGRMRGEFKAGPPQVNSINAIMQQGRTP